MATKRGTLTDWLAEQSPYGRRLIVHIGSGLVAYFIAVTPVHLAGHWSGSTMQSELILIGIILAVGIVGALFKRVLVVTTIAWLAVFLLFLFATITTEQPRHWLGTWPVFFFPAAALFINGFLLRSYYAWESRLT